LWIPKRVRNDTENHMNNLIQRSLLNALGTIAYVSIVVTIMQNGERIFNGMNQITAPIAFLTLFVLSAAITGGLVVGKPVMLFLENQKSDAIKLFIYTLCWLALAVVILLVYSSFTGIQRIY